eukprot:COSAG03_NODE_5928_length_1146_cov_14.035339_2_plen_42_part_00
MVYLLPRVYDETHTRAERERERHTHSEPERQRDTHRARGNT